jgi:hypothetical protein
MEMLGDIAKNEALYTKLQGGKKLINIIIQGLTVESMKSKITNEKWLNKLSHGQILANIYQRPICFLSLMGSTSFFPLRLGPNSKNYELVYLLHIDGTHWVLAHVEGNNGVKQIPPPFLAPKHTTKKGKAWFEHLKQGLNLYQ